MRMSTASFDSDEVLKFIVDVRFFALDVLL